ncbi:MAG: helix-turn-helix domain-containing protein [Proteobacteria bacterium]|nr:helix-turn-helix domain-containing protein [Pseudomonadota bacterium]
MSELKPNVYAAACPSREILVLIGEKWVCLVVGALSAQKILRFGELKRICEGVSQKMLTQTLRKLERDGLVIRTVYADELPLKVEYQLSPLGKSLVPVIQQVKSWAETNLNKINNNRIAFEQNNNKA